SRWGGLGAGGATGTLRRVLRRLLLRVLDPGEYLGRAVVPGGEVAARVRLLLALVEILGAQRVLRGAEAQLGLLAVHRVLDRALGAGVARVFGHGPAGLVERLVAVAAPERRLGRAHELALGFDGGHRDRRRRQGHRSERRDRRRGDGDRRLRRARHQRRGRRVVSPRLLAEVDEDG